MRYVCFSLLAIATAVVGATPEPVANRVPFKARPFPLSDVRLLDGSFKEAMVRDQQYLLELDPDRLLHNFRVNAGLPSWAQRSEQPGSTS